MQHADHIVVLDRGRSTSCGSHEDLLARDPLYRDLATSQMLRPGGGSSADRGGRRANG
ncbi:hypothetical protein [Streptomyces chartreusis]|uniref:hypothetical protein n=1 Tax=Streptomyces chartreusis TaxID=1969 RepID=UPI00362D8CAA